MARQRLRLHPELLLPRSLAVYRSQHSHHRLDPHLVGDTKDGEVDEDTLSNEQNEE
jgi:hypothetical protein